MAALMRPAQRPLRRQLPGGCGASRRPYLRPVLCVILSACALLFFVARPFMMYSLFVSAGVGDRQPSRESHDNVRQQVTVVSDGSVRLYNPDVETVGRLRGLGRLLFITGDKLVGASAEMTGNIREGFSHGEANIQHCGSALRDAAGALLQQRWAEADRFIDSARAICGTFLPNENLAAIQALLTEESLKALPNAAKALKGLGSVLENHAEVPSLQPEWPSEACFALEEMLVEAAGACRAAARLLATPATAAAAAAQQPRTTRKEASEDDLRRLGGPVAEAAAQAGVPYVLALQIEQELEQTPPGRVDTTLRSLLQQFHPDRFPGKESEVLPIFHYVQRLRENTRFQPWNVQ